MKNKVLQLLLLFSLFIATTTSCDNDDEKCAIEIEKESVTVDVKGGVETVKVTAKGYWEIKEIPDWITASPSAGENATDVVITVKANEETTQRTISLLFVCGNDSRILDVKQLSINESDAFIELDKDVLFMSIEGDEQKVKLTTNRPWEMKNIPDWLTIDPVSGNGSTEIIFKIKENRQPDGRNVDLVVAAENVNEKINVTQSGLKDVIRVPTLGMFRFEHIEFPATPEADNYEMKAKNLFVNPSIKDKIYLGNLVSHNAGSNIDIPEFTGYTFNPVDVSTSAAVRDVTTTFVPSQTAQTDFVRHIIDQNPSQQISFTIDKSGFEFYTYRLLHTVGMINLGIKLDELVSGYSYTQQEMTKKYGMILSFKQVLFSVDMDFPSQLILEELSESDLAKGVSYVSTVHYGRVGLLVVESDTDSRDVKTAINKVIGGESLTAAESNLIESADISHVYFTNDNEAHVKKGGLDAVNSYKEAIGNTKENVCMVGFGLNDFTDHSNNSISFSFKLPE